MANYERRFPIGAEVLGAGQTHFRVWAPKAQHLDVVIERDGSETFHPLLREENGYFSGEVPATARALYRYRLDGGVERYPDLASRFQPGGPLGPSQVIDPAVFEWSDVHWPGLSRNGQVIYEMHIGTFTREGTWKRAALELPDLARLGITCLEVMPVNDFPGPFGWGYDGVDLFAPKGDYGEPDDFRRFVDEAHANGIGVILDVVYNHTGPAGNYFREFADDYFSDKYECEWGVPFNFDGENSGPVREFFIANVRYWVEEYHLDGFRIDATQSIFDDSPEHLLTAITREARKQAGARQLYIVGENEPQLTSLIRPASKGGNGLDALWNDDFHHTAMVALTGRDEAYYTDYRGTPQEFISCAKYGYLYQGQHYKWQKKRRGTPAFDLEPAQFIAFLENHDQVANSGFGRRVHMESSPGKYRAMTALLLLGPWTPMLFQGQEFFATSHFFYFNDLREDLREEIAKGRADSLRQFPSIASKETMDQLVVPSDSRTFERSKLDLDEREKHSQAYALHFDLLQLRKGEAAFRKQRRCTYDGAVLGRDSFLLRYFGPSGDDRLLLINLGRTEHLSPAPEPLLAPPVGKRWQTLWSSESPKYGGPGIVEPETDSEWHLPGESAIVLKAGDDSGS
jgi:maltooligosyltrehalose trehalohydrolase